jgi:AcrR family transcriptional regulator
LSAPRVRAPQQQRSRDSLERVLAAGIDVLAEEGWEGFTVARVATAAGASVGLIYGRFDNKDALFGAIQDRFMADVESLHAERFQGPDWERATADQIIRKAVDAVAAGFSYNPSVLRVSMLRAAVDSTVYDRGHRAMADLSQRFENALLARRRDFTHPDPEIAVKVCFRMVFATLSRRIMFGPTLDGEDDPGWDRTVHELGSACVGLLLHTP